MAVMTLSSNICGNVCCKEFGKERQLAVYQHIAHGKIGAMRRCSAAVTPIILHQMKNQVLTRTLRTLRIMQIEKASGKDPSPQSLTTIYLTMVDNNANDDMWNVYMSVACNVIEQRDLVAMISNAKGANTRKLIALFGRGK